MFIICFFFVYLFLFLFGWFACLPLIFPHLCSFINFYYYVVIVCRCCSFFVVFFFIFFLNYLFNNYLFICSRYSCIITILIINVIKFFFIFILPLNVIIIGVVSFFLNVYLNVIATFPLQITLIRWNCFQIQSLIIIFFS